MTHEAAIETTDPKDITPLRTAVTFATVGACSATLLTVLDRAYGTPMPDEETASNPLGGGIVQHGYQCGQLWGASLAAGAQAYRVHGAGPKAEAAAVRASQRIVSVFEETSGDINCLEITEMTGQSMQQLSNVLKYMIKAGPISCGRLAMRFAPIAKEAIDETLAEEPPEVTSPCASCAATVARRLGASEQHQVMAAGLAGGIGLRGGACGALGAAVWLTALNRPEEKTGLTAGDTTIGRVIEAFGEASGHEFECEEIVGRRFEDVADHARHASAGGCARILDALVAAATDSDVAAQDEDLHAA